MQEDTGITFTCPHCSQSLEAESDMVGQMIECPACQKTIPIPSPRSSKPQLTLRERPQASRQMNPPPSSTLSCKYCGAQHGADAVFCVGCGRNLRTGKPLQTRTETPQRQTHSQPGISGGSVLFLIVLAVGGYFVWQHVNNNQTKPTQAVAPATPPINQTTPQPKKTQEEMLKEEMAQKVNAILTSWRDGTYEYKKFIFNESVSMLISPTEWQIRNIEVATFVTVTVFVKSSNRGGMPIQKNWDFGFMKNDGGQWVLFVLHD
jgi:DNA-directed RNA polymerase subunit RPC12/RpoP